MAGRRDKKLWIIPAAAVCAVIAIGGLLTVRGLQNRASSKTVGTASAEDDSDFVTYNGKKYIYNDHLSNFLFLGIDSREIDSTAVGQTDAGQSDVIMVLSWDRVEGDTTLISIPRDTMTEIEAFDTSGESLGTSRDHLSLAYAYGDGGRKSCELSRDAVSKLFYGIPIQGYCAVNMESIPVMTEAIGGLTVQVPDDSLEEKYPEFQQGTEILLTGENAEAFVRYRDITKHQSALERMERQEIYLNAYAAKARDEFQANPGFVTDLYEELQPYMVTNIGVDQFVKIMEGAESELIRWTVPGEGVEGTSFDEYQVDDSKLYEKILQTFYEETE